MRASKSTLKPGSKLEKLYDYLKKETVGEELLFTTESTRLLMGELDVKNREAIWNMLHVLDKKGLVKREKRTGQQGIFLTFRKEPIKAAEGKATRNRKPLPVPSQETIPQSSQTQTLDEVIASLASEIKELGKQRAARVKTHQKLVKARAELNRK